MMAEIKADSTYDVTPEKTIGWLGVNDRFTVDALGLEAKAAHVVERGYHRNRRRREAFDGLKQAKKDKGKAVKCDDPGPIPRRQLRKAVHVAELASQTTSEGITIHEAHKLRRLPDGLGSLGTRALHVKVKVGSLDNEEIRGCLDSGADITLMSEEFWASIPGIQKPREGIHMTLYHLTGQAKVLGYVRTWIYMVSKDGEVIRFELEAYVVRNMKVPLLIGEDFQSSYELGVKRWATGHCEVQVGDSRHIIPASSAHVVDLGFKIRRASMAKTMKRLLPGVWRKTYQRSKARRRREGKMDSPPVLATQDILITAGSVHNIPNGTVRRTIGMVSRKSSDRYGGRERHGSADYLHQVGRADTAHS
jgi:hypothetical protein